MSLTRIGSVPGANLPGALEETARATEPNTNSRLEIIQPRQVCQRGHRRITLEQEWHETPRSFLILFVGFAKRRSERRLLDRNAIGIGESQTRKAGCEACPISQRQSESQQT